MKRWMLYTKKGDFNKISEEFSVSPVIARIMVNRDVENIKDFLEPDMDKLHDPFLFRDMQKTVDKLIYCIENNKKIRVVGDYDIDGVCSTFIYIKALRQLGALVDYEIPDRVKDGYGINEDIIKKSFEDNCDLILTCDNGIAAFEAMELAKELKLEVIITDHHEVFKEDGEDRLPPAYSIVNPKREDCGYPFKEICGALVAYKVMQALFSRIKENRKTDELKKIEDELLEMAAIATVGDVMKLRGENRIIVSRGLLAINNTKNFGLSSLINSCELGDKQIQAYHIGFILGPCLNASGRLESAKTALKMLLSTDAKEAQALADYLKELNDERKELTLKNLDTAIKIVDEELYNESVLVIYLPDCHESLAGIIAGRVKERYNKPCIVLTDTPEGDLKGSARSIKGYHIFEKLCEVDDLLLRYGGHPMAAGMSLKKENLNEFSRRLNMNSNLSEDDFIEEIWIDAAMPFSYIDENIIEELELLEPFGNGNEKPLFAQKDVKILSQRIFGERVIKLVLEGGEGIKIDGLIFTDTKEFMLKRGENCFMDIIYYPQINEYMGRKSLQVLIKEWKFK